MRVYIHRSGRAGKRGRGAFPMTIRPQRPPTESRPRSATPNKSHPRFPPLPHPSLRNHLVERPNKSDRRDWRALSIKNDETERRAARGSPRASERASGLATEAPAVLCCIARDKLIPPPCPFRRNKLKRLGIPRGCSETVLRLASDGGENKRERGVPLVRENWKKCAPEEQERWRDKKRKRGR